MSRTPRTRSTRPEPEIQTIEVSMPVISLRCPYCKDEDDHADIFDPSDGIGILGEGRTFCHHCGRWFDVTLVP